MDDTEYNKKRTASVLEPNKVNLQALVVLLT